MKRTALTVTVIAGLAALLAVALPGCKVKKQENGSSETQQQETQSEEPGGYLGALNKGRKSAKQTAALSKLKNEIGQFKASKGRTPRSLKELEQWRGAELPDLPKGQSYSYDPQTGELTVTSSGR